MAHAPRYRSSPRSHRALLVKAARPYSSDGLTIDFCLSPDHYPKRGIDQDAARKGKETEVMLRSEDMASGAWCTCTEADKVVRTPPYSCRDQEKRAERPGRQR